MGRTPPIPSRGGPPQRLRRRQRPRTYPSSLSPADTVTAMASTADGLLRCGEWSEGPSASRPRSVIRRRARPLRTTPAVYSSVGKPLVGRLGAGSAKMVWSPVRSRKRGRRCRVGFMQLRTCRHLGSYSRASSAPSMGSENDPARTSMYHRCPRVTAAFLIFHPTATRTGIISPDLCATLPERRVE
jgi:hypothetical protein